MGAGFKVEIPELDRLVRELHRSQEEMRSALNALRDTGPKTTGSKELDNACDEFHDSWDDLDREFARLALEADRGRFNLHTKIAHRVGHEVHPDGYRLGVLLHPREYRGVPLSALQRLASAHSLALEASTDLRDGVVLRPVHAKDSW
ncbi:hypothetical protein [Streptomyces sp. MAI_2237]